ncbi:MAG: DNA adenine methylase [Spirochaetaceae bacterium]|jgi:adenine-specific DNA-methyltransferase|nr:DNA adenine methylase [Spirochaetaceae bacterium]
MPQGPAPGTGPAGEGENPEFLTTQIITYIGNKRALLGFIGRGVEAAQKRLGKNRLDIFDVFSGAGIVARYFKRYAARLLVNDVEDYARVTNECYLANKDDIDLPGLRELHRSLLRQIDSGPLTPGIISELYAPRDDRNIQRGERVFYTRRNALYIDTVRALIDTVEESRRKFFLAPLLAEASVHSNTAGVFKGFYKNRETGVGQFGGRNRDALARITGEISLPFPVFSNFNCPVTLYTGDSNHVIQTAPEVDLAYLDPPYNQHPYGSNYFMLNVILRNTRPQGLSKVSGIPADWNRSAYNKKHAALTALQDLCRNIRAKFVLISFNSDGFIPLGEMQTMLRGIGRLTVLETPYNTFRGCRNLAARNIHVTEYLYLLEK